MHSTCSELIDHFKDSYAISLTRIWIRDVINSFKLNWMLGFEFIPVLPIFPLWLIHAPESEKLMY